jgi:predicted transcriptional regulator
MTDQSQLTELAADIVSAYVANNSVAIADLPGIIADVYRALGNASGAVAPEPENEALVPPVPIKRSVTPDYLISLEDGKKYKSLKRHLKGRGLTPDEYRSKWGLPPDYPMVSKNYSAARSELARVSGLGQRRRKTAPPTPPPAPAAKRGRPRKVAV